MANEWQGLLVRNYPGIFALPVDVNDIGAIEAAADDVGDTLFTFLWRELGNAEGAPAADLLLGQAVDDVEAVKSALESAPDGTLPRSVLLASYPGMASLPLDPADETAVDESVRAGETGDDLFAFLWRELGDASSLAEAARMTGTASQDIQSVRDGLPAAPVHI